MFVFAENMPRPKIGQQSVVFGFDGAQLLLLVKKVHRPNVTQSCAIDQKIFLVFHYFILSNIGPLCRQPRLSE
jgi:hypothetical protein